MKVLSALACVVLLAVVTSETGLADERGGSEAFALPGEDSPEIEPGLFVYEEAEIAAIQQRFGVSSAEAAEIAHFEQVAVIRVGDILYKEFPDQMVTTEADSMARLLRIYVSGDGQAVRAEAESAMANEGTVEVLAGFLPLGDVEGAWERLEQRLLQKGLVVAGALGPNSIKVWASDPAAAAQMVQETDVLPPAIDVVINPTPFQGVEDAFNPVGGWPDRPTYSSTWGICTLGFAATRSNGDAGMVTAGHCPEASGSTRRITGIPGWVSSSSCLTQRRTLQYYNDASNPELDAQFMIDEPGSAGSCINVFNDDVCSNAVYESGDNFWRCISVIDVSGWSWTNTEQTTVVNFGTRGGLGLGTIEENLYDPCGPCSANYVLVEVGHSMQGGDSGGPVRKGSTLQGIVKGRFENDFSMMIYTKVGHINSYGMQPATSPVGPN